MRIVAYGRHTGKKIRRRLEAELRGGGASMKLFEHHGTMLPRGLRGNPQLGHHC